MSSATIIFCDIAGFSKKASDIQKDLVESLTSEVLYIVRSALIQPFKTTDLVALPTGDGIAIAYLHSNKQRWKSEAIIELTFKLHNWAFRKTTIDNPIKLRIGIHVGAVDFLVDINNNTNICGDSINTAQRIMDASNPMQTLISEQAFKHYFGVDQKKRQIVVDSRTIDITCGERTEVFVKHGVKLTVYCLIPDFEVDWYEIKEPFSKNIMLLTSTPLPKEIDGDFTERLTHANEIALIQLTGSRLLQKLDSLEIKLSSELEKLWILMPSKDSYGEQYYKKNIVGKLDIKTQIENWKKYLLDYSKNNSHVDVRLITFFDPAFIGASYLNWTKPGGRIHVSPYIWGVKATECPGYNLDWICDRMPEIYNKYVIGLSYLCKNGERIL